MGVVKATHVLCCAYFVAFLVLKIGESAGAWHLGVLQALGVGDATSVAAQPWTLVTHVLVHRDPLEGILAVAILLLAGRHVEERFGASKFLAFYALCAVFVAVGHVGLVEAGVAKHRLFAGSLGASCGLLTAYLFLMPERRVGSMPYPIFYVVAVASLFAFAWLLGVNNDAAYANESKTKRKLALDGTNESVEVRLEYLGRAGFHERNRPDHLAHLLGFACGGLALGFTAAAGRYRERARVRREIRGLQEEVEVRARVETLLEKISQDGIESLSRADRKFLRYASRFYRPQPSPGKAVGGAPTADAPTADLA